MFVLLLNPINERLEIMHDIAWSETKENLLKFLEAEKADIPYEEKDENGKSWYKTFKKGSKLENYNLPADLTVAYDEQILQVETEENVIANYRHWLSETKNKLFQV